jgi:putative ABC transport system permease protein
MKTLDILRLTLQSLKSNLLRSGLTTFGVFMGVAAVNATLQVKNISQSTIAQQLAEREAPHISLYVSWRSDKKLATRRPQLSQTPPFRHSVD